MLAIGSPITSIHISTTCTSLLRELEQIWNDIGETEKDKDRMLMELERECLDFYRRKVDEAANTKARFHQSVAAKEAEIATLMAALGEHDIHSPIKTDKRSASLKEKLASVTPLVEELKKKKEERLKLFADIKTQIEKISGEICGIHPVNDDVSSTDDKDEQVLSLRRLNEYQTHLRGLQKEKSDRLQKVLQCVNEVHSLCGVLGLDFGQTVEDVHPSLHGTQVEQSTNISNSTLEGLKKTILKLKTERKVRIQKLKDIVANLFELWNLMDTSKEERNTFLRITSIVATSPSEITERGGLSTNVIEKASAEVEKLAKLRGKK